MKTLTALVLATGLSLSAVSPAVAMTDSEVISMGQSMLIGALYNRLRGEGYSTDGIENLTLNEVVQLKTLLDGDESDNNAEGRVKLLLERASER